MSKLLELFDEFARPAYVELVLKRDCQLHNFILVYDEYTRQAYLHLNFFDEEGELIEFYAPYCFELYDAIMEHLRSVLFTSYWKDPEMFFAEETIILSEFMDKHIENTYFDPKQDVFVMQLDIPLSQS